MDFCKQNGFRYAGTQYSKECYCSNRRPSYRFRAPDEDCNTKCGGNEDEMCGGNWRLSVYDTSSTQLNENLPNNYMGCYWDDVNKRTLDGLEIASETMNSPEYCVGLCYNNGTRFAGVEWGKECFCGNQYPAKLVAGANDCKTPCTGDATSKCGGNNALSIYSTGIKQLDASDLKPVYLGCYVDPGLLLRLMTGDSVDRPGTLTNEMCMLYCADRGFRYAGTQWKQQCFCSSTKPKLGNAAEEKDCSLPCDGDQDDICGGDFRLSVYDTQGLGENPVAAQYIGCYQDSEERLLKGPRQDSNKLTPQLCLNFCQKKGFVVAGVQFGAECFCGHDIDRTKKVSDNDCSSTCSGDDKIKCGGSWRLSVYRGTGSQTAPGYVGCYSDDESQRTLQGPTIVTESLTQDYCIGYCLRRGFRYAGAENGKECFCGDKLVNGQKLDDGECQNECNGDRSQFCGGILKLTVFETAKDSVGPPPRECKPTSTTVNGKSACQGQLVFQEDFRQIDLQKWAHDLYMPTLPDYQFVVYSNDPSNVFTKNGRLYIKPTVFNDTYVTSGKLNIQQCTGQLFTQECQKEAAFFSILPPVRTARITTKESFSFKYGIVEIRAKLPSGDWIVPEIWLDPKRYSQYGQHYSSGRVRLAMARGNPILISGQQDIGNRLLETGVALGVESDIAALSARWTSREQGGWGEQFHNYTFIWSEEDLSFSVDNSKPISLLSRGRKLKDTITFKNTSTPQVWNSGNTIAPFDQEFNIVLGLSVGGLRDFPDNCLNGRDREAKPWSNTDFKAMAKFFQAGDKWQRSWNEDKTALQVDWVRVTAL